MKFSERGAQMANKGLYKIGNLLFSDIDQNEYLNELYEQILYNYAIKQLNLTHIQNYADFNVTDALRFADLLSKSTHPEKREQHHILAQEIVTLLLYSHPDNETIRIYAGFVFSNTGNYPGRKLIASAVDHTDMLDELFSAFRSDYLAIPGETDMKFLAAQKKVYQRLKDEYFSYSGPTSMGKSFIMRKFIKAQVQTGVKNNYALLVPTKALINEIRSQTINDMKSDLEKYNYRVVTSSGEIALKEKHNFIFILTPERMLYLLIERPDLKIDYIFIDEAHKLSGKNRRAPFYYQVVNLLLNRNQPHPHFIFASPNVPNPEVYLRLLSAESANKERSLASTYSPVVQVKFFVDENEGKISVYNERANKVIDIGALPEVDNLLNYCLHNIHLNKNGAKNQQTIVFYGSKQKAIDNAINYAANLEDKNDARLNELARDIEREIHSDYYLAKIIRRGVAYHIGYLPSAVRMRIEDLFREGSISTMFCTSTLLEGVNLPADNLLIMGSKISRSKMTPIDFRNLIGRVGRIEYNLHGNVFFVSEKNKTKKEEYIKLLDKNVPEQVLSIESSNVLKKAEKEAIVETLVSGSVSIEKQKGISEEVYLMMRKFALILVNDITHNRNSIIKREFEEYLTAEDEQKIREAFLNKTVQQDDDINISVDQTSNLVRAIQNGLAYPEKDSSGKFVYNDILNFLEQLCSIFKWEQYESTTLGRVKDGQHTLLRWYAVILSQWMEGHGLSFIISRALNFRKENPHSFWYNYKQTTYKDDLPHRNSVISDTLEVIENIILFSISNYFLRFSNEYKRVHGATEFDNNWYEYVEYGTTSPLTILLQRHGFSRETSTYIRNNKTEYVLEDEEGKLKLRSSLLEASNFNVRREANEIRFNSPEIFDLETYI